MGDWGEEGREEREEGEMITPILSAISILVLKLIPNPPYSSGTLTPSRPN